MRNQMNKEPKWKGSGNCNKYKGNPYKKWMKNNIKKMRIF